MRLRRSPLPFWMLAIALALGTGLTVTRLVGQASARAARLGGLIDVPVASRPVEAGDALRSLDVRSRRLPADAVPHGRVASSPVGKVALMRIVPGEVLLASKLAPEGLRGVAALVPRGQRALSVPVERGGLSLRRGNRVDVLATFDVAAEVEGEPAVDPGPPTFPVATGALVVDVGEESVTVAVSPEEAPRVAFALARGTVTLALTDP